MTETFYRTGRYNADHSTFGGIICLSDFTIDHGGKSNTSGSAIAKRIAGDKGFDEQCRKNIQYRERKNHNGK